MALLLQSPFSWFSSSPMLPPTRLKSSKLCCVINPDGQESSEAINSTEAKKIVPDRVKLAFEKANAYKESMKSNSGLRIEDKKIVPDDRVKLAFEKAKAYKESMKSNSGLGIEESSGGEDNSVKEDSNVVDGREEDVPDWLKIALEKAEENKQNKGVAVSETDQGLQGGSERTRGENMNDNSVGKKVDLSDNNSIEAKKIVPDRVRLAFEKAKAYKESMKSNSGLGIEKSSGGEDNSVKVNPNVVDGGQEDVPDWLKIAMEKAEKNKQNKGVAVSETDQGLQGGSERTRGENMNDNSVSKRVDLSDNNSIEAKKIVPDRVRLAFEKAKAYKESMKSNSGLGIEKSSGGEDNSVKENPNVVDGGQEDVPDWLKIAMEKAEKNKQNKGVAVSETDQGLQGGSERTRGENMNDNSVGKKVELSVNNSIEAKKIVPDRVRLAFEKAKAYKESMKSNSGLGIEKSSGGEDNSVKENPNVVDGGQEDVPDWLKIAMEKAEKNKQNKGVAVSETDQGLQGGSERTRGENMNDNSVGKKVDLSVNNSIEAKTIVPDRVRLAFEKAKAYKESMKSNSGLGIEKSSGGEDNSVKENPNVVDGGQEDVPDWLKIALEKAEKNKQNKGVAVSETDQDSVESSEVINSIKAKKVDPADRVKLAFEKAKAYKESMKSNSGLGIEKSSGGEDNLVEENPNVVDGGEGDVPDWLKIAMEKAEKNKQNKGVAASETDQGLQGESERTWGENMNDNSVGKKVELSVSKLDFVGLDFADKKKTRGLPPGLAPISDPYLDGDFPEVELIVGDKTKFDAKTTAPQPEQTTEDESDLYKPKVSTWGVFPRPNNISKTFGGGRVIRPGEVLETAEEKAIKEERTKQTLAAYKKKYGLNIDPKLKAECQEELNKGDLLMDAGKLKAAIPYYEKVIDKLPFESELHGLAALQWAICLDSLTRHNEARSMYEKLKSHPNGKVGKTARQFVYSFEAMEMMKVKIGSSSYSKDTSYQSYFDAFIENKTVYTRKVKDEVVQESSMNQVILYLLFLTSPIFVVLLLALQKRI